MNPNWSAFTVYHEARKIVSTVLQITYERWIKLMLGRLKIMKNESTIARGVDLF